ncbi:MAG: mechanosensitive ion channel domain-containing protein [Phycisphaerales bacterium]
MSRMTLRLVALPRPAFRLALATLVTIMALGGASAFAQDQPATGSPEAAAVRERIRPLLSAEEIARLREEAENLVDLDEAKRNEILGAFDDALQRLQTARDMAAETARFQSDIDGGPALLADIRAELAQPPQPPKIEIPPNATAAELEQLQTQAEAQLIAAQQEVRDLQQIEKTRDTLREQLPTQIAQLRQQIQAIDDQFNALARQDTGDPHTRARLVNLLAQRQALDATATKLERERQRNESRRETLKARQERAARRVIEAESVVGAWRDAVTKAREREAKQTAEQARAAVRSAADQNETIRAYADRFSELSAEQIELAPKLSEAQQRLVEVTSLRRTIREQFEDTFEQAQSIGLTDTFGLILRGRRSELPNIRSMENELRRRQERVAEAVAKRVQLESLYQQIKDVGVTVQTLMGEMDEEYQVTPEMSAEEQARITEQRQAIELLATDLINDLKSTLLNVTNKLRTYTETLRALDEEQRQLIDLAKAYFEFIDERILWIRSADPLSGTDFEQAPNWFLAISSAAMWDSIGAALRIELGEQPLNFVLPTLALGLWFFILVRAIRAPATLDSIATRTEKSRLQPSFRLTLEALGVSLVAAANWPLLLVIIAWFIRTPADTPPAGQVISDSLIKTAIVFFALQVARLVCRRRGLGRVHFQWPMDAVVAIRRQLIWFDAIVLPAVFVMTSAEPEGTRLTNMSMARLAFIVGMIALSIFLLQIGRPRGPVLGGFLARRRGSWIDRLRGIWFAAIVLVPIGLAVLAAIGYFYSAQRLERAVRYTLLISFAVVLASALFYRWLWVVRRRIAIEQARKKREAAEAQQETGLSSEEAAGESAPIQEEEIHLPTANAQTLQLFRSGAFIALLLALWGVWIDVLPALGIFDQFELWPDFGYAEAAAPEMPEVLRDEIESVAEPVGATPAPTDPEASTTTTPDRPFVVAPGDLGSESDGTNAESEPIGRITLGNLLIAGIIVLITVVAVRNIPGVLEIVLLQRLPLDAGSRYAISSISRYALLILGVTLAFGAVGIGWSKIQWLAAALTFGLAFGLQEIFANFISGLIILVERPMRVGDTVTVANINGTVTRIRMRATTITDWNRKELIVPNKEFITSQLVNWTLSDPVLRLQVPVGIAYGSDTQKAKDILIRVARQNANVLDDPAPQAMFMGFGDSSLNFELRVFIPHIEFLISTQDALLFAIDQEFRKAKIEIAFPQRDIHIRTIEAALPVRRSDFESEPDGADPLGDQSGKTQRRN